MRPYVNTVHTCTSSSHLKIGNSREVPAASKLASPATHAAAAHSQSTSQTQESPSHGLDGDGWDPCASAFVLISDPFPETETHFSTTIFVIPVYVRLVDSFTWWASHSDRRALPTQRCHRPKRPSNKAVWIGGNTTYVWITADLVANSKRKNTNKRPRSAVVSRQSSHQARPRTDRYPGALPEHFP